jgi:hypothetical protein
VADEGWAKRSEGVAAAEALGAMAMAHAGWLLSGASCGGSGAHGDKPPRALGGGQRLWRGCGVWTEVKRTMDKEVGGPWAEPIVS